MVVEREVAHVERQRASGALLFDDHRDGAALDAFAKTDPATTGEACVRESLQHPVAMILQEGLQLFLELLFRQRAEVPLADRAITCDEDRGRQAEDGAVGVFRLG